MAEPKVIKDFPGQAVEQWRRTHGGFLPTEQAAWIEHLVMAIRASGWPRITDTEIDDLQRLALLGVKAERESARSESVHRWIPVSEKRPLMGQRVLLWDKHRGLGVGWWVFREDTENAWQFNNTFACNHFNVTHWQEELEGPSDAER